MTPIFYAFREREMIQDMLESVTGARMHHSYCRVGGLKDDLPRGFLKRSAEVLAATRKRIKEFETLIMGNEIVFARTPERGRAARRMSPWPTDARVRCCTRAACRWIRARTSRTRSTREVEFNVPVGQTGDCYDRLWVLIERMKESCDIIEQCMDKLPPGQFRAEKLPKTLKMSGEVYVRTENPLGHDGLLRRGRRQDRAVPAEDAHRRRSRTSA